MMCHFVIALSLCLCCFLGDAPLSHAFVVPDNLAFRSTLKPSKTIFYPRQPPQQFWSMQAADDDDDEDAASDISSTETSSNASSNSTMTSKAQHPSSSPLSAVASKRDSTLFPQTPPKLKKSHQTNRWDTFDYLQHWYPVIWACDVPVNRPTKVTLFDVDYVVAVDSNGQWSALKDQCPHKAAALSEGRMTKSGLIQCAYHGWSFDGQTGACQQIPQAGSGVSTFPQRACAQAIPITEHQSMIWLWPGPVRDKYPSPPTVPEMDYEGWKTIRVVRDFPMVDWSLLVSNILDPDHGLFAHGALAFDFYSGSAEHPQETQENFDNAGWTLAAQVDSVDKLLQADREKRIELGMKVKDKKEPATPLRATSNLYAPSTVSMCRRDPNGDTNFVTAFWVCPVGTGRSRFMSASIGKMPFSIPRWVFHVTINRFLDQDTVLVASQQSPILTAEAEGVEKPRHSLFAYGSATDKTVRLIDQFWDSTLYKAPNRHKSLMQLYHSGNLLSTPPREVVLDRQSQHLAICPDSQKFVRNCKAIRNGSLAFMAGWLANALWKRSFAQLQWLPIVSGVLAWATEQLRKQFYFCKTEASRDKDLKQTPLKAWLDPQ